MVSARRPVPGFQQYADDRSPARGKDMTRPERRRHLRPCNWSARSTDRSSYVRGSGPYPLGSATSAGVTGHLAGDGEAAQELEAFFGGAARFGGVGEHEPFRVGWQVHRLVGEFEISD